MPGMSSAPSRSTEADEHVNEHAQSITTPVSPPQSTIDFGRVDGPAGAHLPSPPQCRLPHLPTVARAASHVDVGFAGTPLINNTPVKSLFFSLASTFYPQ